MRPPYETFKGPVCRGSYALGNQCGRCEKCEWEASKIADGCDSPPEPNDFLLDSVQAHREMLGGIGLRDWFAGLALQALVGRDNARDKGSNNSPKWAVVNPVDNYREQAERAYLFADAMLAARGNR